MQPDNHQPEPLKNTKTELATLNILTIQHDNHLLNTPMTIKKDLTTSNGLSQSNNHLGTNKKELNGLKIQADIPKSAEKEPVTLSGATLQSDDHLPDTSKSAKRELETEQRGKTNSFIEIIRRVSANSLIYPAPINLETSEDEKDSQLKSSSEIADDKKRVCSNRHVFLQYCTLFALCFNGLFVMGTCFSLGVLYVSFREEFEASNTVTALIISVCVGIFGIGGVFSGMLVDRIGVRWSVILSSLFCSVGLFLSAFVTNIWYLLIVLGFLFGSGSSIMNVATSVSVSKIFHKNKSTMLMYLTASSPAGTFIMPQIMKVLEDIYSWRGMLIVLSGLALNMCFAGFLSFHLERPTTEKQKKQKFFDMTILRNKIFLTALLASSLASSSLTVVTTIVVDFWKKRGNSMWQSVTILTIHSAFGITSRFIFGVLNSIYDLTNYFYPSFYIMMVLGGLCISLIPQCVTFVQVSVVILMSGFTHGIMSTIRPAIVLIAVGLDSYSVAFGLIFTCFGLGTLIATTLAGKISDITKSYDVSIYAAGITEIVGGLITFLLHLWLARKSRNKEPDTAL